jgi:peptidoglycan/LPS O-acetylase OafA/YrhL
VTDIRERLLYIDAIRGMAALSVVIFHALLWYPGSLTDGVGQFIDFGKFGVVLFFMVSGFIIPFSLDDARADGLRVFIIRRIFRLYPAYWVSLAGAAATAIILGFPLSLTQFAVNMSMLQGFFRVGDVLPVYWTLLIELIFYSLCAVLFHLGVLRRIRVLSGMSLGFLLLALPMAWARWYTGATLPVALPLSLSLMFSATLWRHYLRDRDIRARRHALALLSVFLVSMPLISLLAYNRNFGFGETWYRYNNTYVLAVAAFLLFSFRWRLQNRALVWVGQISYSVYLFHGLLLLLYGNLLLTSSFIFAHIAAYVSLTLALSYLVFIAVEKPGVRLGKILTRGRAISNEEVI